MKKISILFFMLWAMMWSVNSSAQNAITFWKNGVSTVIDNPDSISFKDYFNPQNTGNAATYWKDGQSTVVNTPDSILFWIYDMVFSGYQDLEETAALTETELSIGQLTSDEETAPIYSYSEEDSIRYDALAQEVLKMFATDKQEEPYSIPQKKVKLSDDNMAQEVIRTNGKNILSGFEIEQQDWHSGNWGNTRYGGFETYYNTTIENSKRYLIIVFYHEGGFPNKKTAYIKLGQLNSGPIVGSVTIYPGRDYAFLRICLDDYLKGYGCVNFFPLLITEGSKARNYINPFMVKHNPIVSPNWKNHDKSFGYEFGTINGVSVNHNGYSYNKAGRLLTNISGGYYQCVELCKRYVKTLNGHIKRPLNTAGWDGKRWGNAIDWPYARKNDLVDKDAYFVFANDGKTKVREGDLIVWEYKTYGHIGVVIKTTEESISIAHQNGGDGTAALPIGTKLKIENGIVKDIAPGSNKSPIFGNGVNPIPYFIRIENINEHYSSYDKAMDVSTTNIEFKKEVEIGGNGAAMPFTITNTGLYKSLDISSIEISRGDVFTTNATPCSISPGESRTFYVTFNPTRPEKYEDRIVIKSNAEDNPTWTIKLLGIGKGNALVGTIKVIPSSIDFGTVSKGVSESRSFVIQNTGAYDLRVRVDQPNAPFNIPEAGKVIIIPAGEHHTMEVICTGLEPGEVVENAYVKISSDATNKDEVNGITLSANGGFLPFQLSTTSLTISKGSHGTVNITSGSGSYSIEKIEPSGVVTASIVDNNIIAIEALTAGTAVITVKDNKSEQTATIEVTVTGGGFDNLITEGLVAYYPFNGNANDESGNGNHGTPSDNVILTEGVSGDANGAYQFGGYDNPGHIHIPNSKSLIFTDGASFSCYLKPTSWLSMDGWGNRVAANGAQCFIAKEHDRRGMAFLLSGSNDNIHFFVGGAPTWAELEGTNNSNFLNKWIHVAFVYGNGHAKLYVDGQLIDERESTPNFSNMNARDLYIGKFSDYWYPFNGKIDEVRIYNRALNEEEIKELAFYKYDEPIDHPTFTLSSNTLALSLNSSGSVQITSGSGSYSIEKIEPSGVVTASIVDNNIIAIEALTVGTAVITVKDTKSGQTATIEVTVTDNSVPMSHLTCPDDNHPHMIDLGLPSGTKWACCNVGANKPEGYGGYYAWGEAEEKSTYDLNTFLHYNDTHNTINPLGSNIACTEFDVAYVQWGGAWCMPSRAQLTELKENCSIQWTTINGVNGTVFKGKNGGTIFLPSAGAYVRSDLTKVGSHGYYWSSTQWGQWDSRLAYLLKFEHDFMGISYDNICYGVSVRPVSVPPSNVNITLSHKKVELFDGQSATVDITSGNGNYTIESKISNLLTAEINGNSIVIKTNNYYNIPDTAFIIVKDIISGHTARIEVIVKVYHYCPDDHHPHMIDLGLPSGTKWACCNVGTDTPEGYGGYYAWGETEEKEEYDWKTYVHCDGSQETCHDIGTDICGTQYDVAHLNWGGIWQIPSFDQFAELANNCSYESAYINGIRGIKYTNTENGNSIFFPYAGQKIGKNFTNGEGAYWSGSLYPNYLHLAHYYDINRYGRYWTSRKTGLPVRPIAK